MCVIERGSGCLEIAAPGALHAVDFSNTEDKKLEPEPLEPFGRETALRGRRFTKSEEK
jgi:hypothetical protein